LTEAQWRPTSSQVEGAQISEFARRASRASGRDLVDYAALHAWSVGERAAFWRLVWDYCGVLGEPGEATLLNPDTMLGCQWFPEARLNFAENLLRRKDDQTAIFFRAEDQVEYSLSYEARDTLDGDTQRRFYYIGGNIETEQQINIGLFFNEGDYRPVSGDSRGEYSDNLRQDDFWTLTMDFNTRSNWLGYGYSISDGFLGGDDYYYVTGYLWVKPTTSTLLNIFSERLDNFGKTDQVVVSGSWDYSRYSSLLFRFVQFEEFEFNRLAYRKTVSDGVDIFMVYNDDSGVDTNYLLKLLWTFN